MTANTQVGPSAYDHKNFDPARFVATIRYSHRFYAEFAREAMYDQVLAEEVTDPIKIQWCVDEEPEEKPAE